MPRDCQHVPGRRWERVKPGTALGHNPADHVHIVGMATIIMSVLGHFENGTMSLSIHICAFRATNLETIERNTFCFYHIDRTHVIKDTVSKHGVSHWKLMRSKGQSIAGHESNVVGSNFYVIK